MQITNTPSTPPASRYTDSLMSNSTLLGSPAFADQAYGSIFIRSLCDVFGDVKLVAKYDICKLLIIVTNRVSNFTVHRSEATNLTQTPGYLVLLRYLFRFRIPLTEDFCSRIILPRFSFGRTGRDEYGVYDLFWPNSAYIEKNSNDMYVTVKGESWLKLRAILTFDQNILVKSEISSSHF